MFRTMGSIPNWYEFDNAIIYVQCWVDLQFCSVWVPFSEICRLREYKKKSQEDYLMIHMGLGPQKRVPCRDGHVGHLFGWLGFQS